MESYRFNKLPEIMVEKYGDDYLEYRKHWADAAYLPENAPLHLDIDLRDACNQHCAMCHQLYRKRTNIVSTQSIIDKALSEASTLGLKSINIGASCESLLEEDLLFYTLSKAQEYKILDTFIHTNAILLTAETAQRLIDSGLKHLCISLDAATEESYLKIRRSDKFKLVEENIKNFIKIRGESFFPELRLSFCLTPINSHEKDLFYQKWENIADLIEFQDYREVENSVKGVDKAARHSCKEGIKRAMLWPNGDIAACCMAWEAVTFGNIADTPFAQIWQSAKAKTIRTSLASGEKLPHVCKMCLAG
ncbi:MAG: radical SAM protein [Deferribacteraceae bacterium]|jgi:radical SAM protein with 4Fe4S-binding SPASM domain|nr:radical SAM protein [Deferribacteraceae bacterium]